MLLLIDVDQFFVELATTKADAMAGSDDNQYSQVRLVREFHN